MIHDRFTVTSSQKFYSNLNAPAPSPTSSLLDPQDYVFDQRTGALTVCQIPPSVSLLQDRGGFNFTA